MERPEDFGEYLQKLIDRHRKDLSILLRDYGIDEEPTPILLMGMMKRHPEFVGHMANLPESRADGGFLDTLSKGYNLITRGKEAVNVLKGDSSQLAREPEAPEPDEKPKWTAKRIVITGIAVVVVLIIITAIVKRVRKT